MTTEDLDDPAGVVTRMFFATDRRDWTAVRSAFADTVQLDYTSLNGGEPAAVPADDMVAGWKSLLSGFDATHHHVTATHRLSSVHGDSLWDQMSDSMPGEYVGAFA